ncbi:hypothetical protein DFO70_12347 [Cytobacillus firmus]|uniref:Uncharacterized protein n=2 Tax=Cytobacillus TaxID=2675230 RepID=A0A366JIF8_CYTFI|nr:MULTISPECIES: hypothetical protein [Cytobacillus]RBP86898.1 hypothetical protein DFO70_12347 [Cytobacillus firmus]TDX36552.1 hypothetical protein DFO72_11848 [Cytobacillus oceanisediminis]
MLQVWIRVSLFLISWLSVIFLPNKKELFVKYLPVCLFSSLTVMCEIFYFTTHKLWTVKGGQKNQTHTAFLLLFGPYIVLTIWFFYLSKGKFLLYALINLVADLIYAFPIIALFKKLNVFQIKVKSINFFLLIFADALLNFGFQKVIEKISLKNNNFSNS